MIILVQIIKNERIIGIPNMIHRSIAESLPLSQITSGSISQCIGLHAIQQTLPEVKKPLRIHTMSVDILKPDQKVITCEHYSSIRVLFNFFESAYTDTIIDTGTYLH